MTDFRERYKRVGYGREDLEANRALRSQRRDEARREMRSEHFSLRRDMGCSTDDDIHLDEPSKPEPLDKTPDQPVEPAPTDPESDPITKRLLELEQWREERKRRRLQEKKKAKPIFKVGVVHHKVYSPPINKNPAPMPPAKLCKIKQSQPEPPAKRVTRATEKRLAVKAVNNQQKRENMRKKKNLESHGKEGLAQEPLAPIDHQFKAPLGLTAIPIFGRYALEATKENMSPASKTNEFFESGFTSVNSSNNHSFILSSNTNLNFQEPNVQKCDSTSFLQNRNDSLNSSVEPISLKVSSDDQEFLNDQDSIVNTTSPKKHSASRRSSSRSQKQSLAISTSINKSDNQIGSDINRIQEDENDRNNVTVNLPSPNNLNKSRRKSIPLLGKESSTILESSTKLNPESDISIDPLSSRKNNMNRSSRRSSKIVADKISNPESSKNTSSGLGNQANEQPIDTTTSIKETQFMGGRRSTRKSTRNNTIEKLIEKATSNQSSIENLKVNSSLNLNIENDEEKLQGIRRSARILADSSATEGECSTKNSKCSPTMQQSPTHLDSHIDPKIDLQGNEENITSSDAATLLIKDTIVDQTPAMFSPFIVSSRGKSSMRKEVQRRRFSQVAPEDIPTKDTVMKALNISVEEEERTAQYYKYILDQEIERLNERCDTWNVVKEADSIPEDARYMILAAIGHTQLLMRKKFERFRRLVLDCETGKGEMLVTCKDLQGFWEMMYREIKDCDNRFDKLEELKSKNWVEDEIEEPKDIQPKKKVVKKHVNKKPVAVAKSSALRAHILALRKKKIEEECSSGIIEHFSVKKNNDTEINNTEPNEPSGNESPTTNKRPRTSTPRSTNKWQSLVKKVQMSQNRKSATSPLIVMKLGQMCKTPEVHLDDSIIYINSDRTPAKGILKTTKDDVVASVAKSANKVFFKEQPMEVQEFHDSYNNTDDKDDDKDEVKEPIERRLDFENDSFNLLEDDEVEDKTPTVSLSPFCSPNKSARSLKTKIVNNEASLLISMSPLSLMDPPVRRSSNRTKKQISFRDDMVETDTDNVKNSKFRISVDPATPRPSRVKTPLKPSTQLKHDVDTGENAATGTSGEQNVVKELYLNADGIICERIIQVQKRTPVISIKRSNSERIPQAKNRTLGLDTTNNTPPSTSRLRRRNTQLANTSIDTSISEEVGKTPIGKLTPQVRRRNSKRSFAETTLTEENVDITMEDTTPKLKKMTPTNFSAKDITNGLNKSLQSPSKPKLRRTKSLTATPRSRKSTTTLSNSIQESIVAAADANLVASSIKRSSKKLHKSEENDAKLSSTPFTPDTRRKSTRIAQARSED